MQKLSIFALLLIVGLSFHLEAQTSPPNTLDPASREALEKTSELLKDKKSREAVVSKDPNAVKADHSLKSLMGSEAMSEEAYALAAEIFPMIVKEANGDAAKMIEILSSYSKNPNALAEKWTPEQRDKLRKLSEMISAKQLQN